MNDAGPLFCGRLADEPLHGTEDSVAELRDL